MKPINTLNQPPLVTTKPAPPPFQLSLEQIRQIKNIYAETPLSTPNLSDNIRDIDTLRYYDSDEYLRFIASSGFLEYRRVDHDDQIDGSLFGRRTEKRIPGDPFRLTIDYLDIFHKGKKDPIRYFDSVTVIGDSLSDSEGRMYKKSGNLLTRANQYYNGRFTNGTTWAEFLTMPSAMQSNQYSTGESEDPSVKFTNKAEGGSPSANYLRATANPQFFALSNIEKQVSHLKFDNKDLAIVFLGANDYMTYSQTDVDYVISSQEKAIQKMIADGSRNIIVMGLPDLSLTPAAKRRTKKYQQKMAALSHEHNIKLKQVAAKMNLQQSCKIQYFDVNQVFEKIMGIANTINAEKPGSYNTDEAFSDGYIRRDNKPLEIDPHYLFIDDVHPTQEVHMIIATELHQFISDKFNPLA
ncbi:SGNH/GDSL hydrolase family protein [Providencia rettgeri]|nr:SGNH/GDSL hydrolase family protein [Providencia rettgeri]